MTFEEALFLALQQQLAPAPLYLGPLPTSGTGIGVTFYDVAPPEGTTDTVQGIQLTVRHEDVNDRRETARLSEEVFQTLHEQTLTTWAGIPVNRVWRNSSADLGAEESGAVLRSDNYYVRCTRTGPNITDS